MIVSATNPMSRVISKEETFYIDIRVVQNSDPIKAVKNKQAFLKGDMEIVDLLERQVAFDFLIDSEFYFIILLFWKVD